MGELNKEGFLFEIQRLHFEIEKVIEKYEMQDEVVSILLTGMIDEDNYSRPVLKAIFSYNLWDEEVMEEAVDFIKDTFNSNSYDFGHSLDDILGDLDIDTEDDE